MDANQIYLFAAPEKKSYPGANGVKLPYWEQDGKIIRIALSDKLILPVTHQKGGHIYSFVPGYGRLEYRGKNAKTSFLSHAATLRRSLKLNESIAGHGQSIVRDAEEQGDLLRAAEAKSLELEAENTRLLAELESLRNRTQKSRRWVNNLALEWALDHELPVGIKVVLITFAAHSDEHGESWPSVEYIAKKSKMDRATVRAAIRSLNAAKLLIDTGRRAGDTHQVKIYRIPEIAIEAVVKATPFMEDESGGKAAGKRRKSGEKAVAVTTANNGIMNNEQEHHEPDELMILGTSVPLVSSNEGSTSGPASESSNFVEGHHHQSHSAREHIKWPEYATWCGSQKGKPAARGGRVHDGIPTESGFWTWLLGQKPEWRKKQSQIEGFELDGKFLTVEEANRIAAENPRLLDEGRFRRARKMQLSDGTWWVEDESGTARSSSFLSEKQ